MLLLSGREGYSLYSARRWVWYYKDLACPKYWSAWFCKSHFWLHVYKTAVHRADVRTHTCRELARECRDGMGDERTKGARACSGTEWYCVGPRVGCRGVDFSDETCFRLREVVTFGSGINSYQGRARSYSIFTMVSLGSYGSMETDQGEMLSLHMPGNHRS